MIELYIEWLEELAAFIKKRVQLPNTTIFEEGSSGLGCVLTMDSVTLEGPQRVGRVIIVNVRVSAPINNWKQLLTTMGRMEQAFQDCRTDNNELSIEYHLTLGAWSRSEDDTNLIFENSLEVRAVRLKTR